MSVENEKRKLPLCPFSKCTRLKNLDDYYSKRIQFYRAQHIELQTKVDNQENVLHALYALFDKGYQLIGIDQSAKGKALAVVCYRRTPGAPASDMFYLYPLPFANADDHVGALSLTFSASGSAYIEDIIAGPPGCGHGSILMKHVLSFLRTIGCKYVAGYLSYVDRDHWDKLIHFYEKFGFTITDYVASNGELEKSIQLCLLKPRNQNS